MAKIWIYMQVWGLSHCDRLSESPGFRDLKSQPLGQSVAYITLISYVLVMFCSIYGCLFDPFLCYNAMSSQFSNVNKNRRIPIQSEAKREEGTNQ